MARIKFDDSIKYVRVRSIEEMDFENLPEEYKRQFARGLVRLLGKNFKDVDSSEHKALDGLDFGSIIEAGVTSDVTTDDSLR